MGIVIRWIVALRRCLILDTSIVELRVLVVVTHVGIVHVRHLIIVV